jgi:hypothetical protein
LIDHSVLLSVPLGVFFAFVGVFGKSVKMSLRPGSRAEGRMKAYKLAVDATEARRKREDGMVEIRKSKRDESLQKKRREGSQQHAQFAPTGQSATTDKKVSNAAFQLRGWSSHFHFLHCNLSLRGCNGVQICWLG